MQKTTGYARLLAIWLLAFVTAALVFLLFPQVDIAFSQLFYAEGFAAAKDPLLKLLRTIYLDSVWALGLLSIGGALWFWWKRRFALARACGYVATGMLLGPGLLTNGILKAYWGRARPDAVAEFGGDKIFSPPLLMSDQCASNCSFVSGEGSGIFAAFFLLTGVFWGKLGPKARVLWVSVGGLIAIYGSGLRVAFGRHFFSDTLFAALFMALIAIVLHRVFRLGSASE
ncbi:MAG TPA: phosphatase PAP2 family protein [Paracoccaceae bacterium]|nr:phosphatase PAP2 family protein [Paracoccaceae bacterium]